MKSEEKVRILLKVIDEMLDKDISECKDNFVSMGQRIYLLGQREAVESILELVFFRCSACGNRAEIEKIVCEKCGVTFTKARDETKGE